MKVLLVEDNSNYAFLVESMLGVAAESFHLDHAATLAGAVARLDREPVDIVLLDLNLTDSQGIATLVKLQRIVGSVPIIVLTGCDDEELALEAMRHGAQDYLLKNAINRRALVRALRYAVERRQNQRRLDRQRQQQFILQELTLAHTSALNLWSLLNILVEHVTALFPDFAVAIWLHDDAARRTEPFARWKFDEAEWQAIHAAPSLNISERVCRSGAPVVLNDLNPTPGADASIHAAAAFPLIVDDRVEGVLGFFAKRFGPIGSGQLKFLAALAGHAAVALRNFRLHARSREQASDLERITSEIRSTQEMYRELVESLDVIVWEQDLVTLEITYISKEFEKILGYSTTPLDHDPEFYLNLIYPADRERVVETFRQEIAAGEVFEIEHRMVALDGRAVWLRQVVRVSKDNTGLPIRLRGVAIDVTASKEAESALRQSVDELRGLGEIGRHVLDTDDIRSALENILDLTLYLGNFDLGSIHLLNGSQDLRLSTQRGYSSQAALDALECPIPIDGETHHPLLPTLLTDTSARIVDNLDAQVSDSWYAPQRAEGAVATAVVPVLANRSLLGLLQVAVRQPKGLAANQARLLEAIANHIGIMIQKSRLYTDAQKKNQELAALFDVSSAASTSLDIDKVLDAVAQRITEIFGFGATRILLFDDAKATLSVRSSHETDARFAQRPHSYRRGQGVSGRAAASGEPIIIGDIDHDPRYANVTRSGTAKRLGQKFLAAFPIRYKDEILGVVNCGGFTPHHLNPHEIQLITSMTNQIAVAVTNAELYARTRAQAEQLRRLANHVERIREEERGQISREIHDQLGQELTALKFDIAWLSGKLSSDQAPIGERLRDMQQMLDGTIARTREIAARLRPDVLDRLGLNAAIEWQLQEFRSRTGINYYLAADSVPQRFSVQQSTALFRILQEALTNIARHSQATRVRVRLELLADAVHLSIDDDGGGIDEGKILDAQSLGLLGMRERAAFLGGRVTIQRNDNKGTTIAAQLPLGPHSKKWNPVKKVGET